MQSSRLVKSSCGVLVKTSISFKVSLCLFVYQIESVSRLVFGFKLVIKKSPW